MWPSFIKEIIEQFSRDVQGARWEEWLSSITQIASVWYAGKNNVLTYPTGIIGVLLAFWLYFFIASPPVYADGLLNLYYFAMSIYGWYVWSQKNDENIYIKNISWCNANELRLGITGFALFFIGIYFLLLKITNSNTPLLDSLVTSTAFTGMWWMARRKIENWIAWIISNLVAIPLNFYKGFMLFTLMYILFLFLALHGYNQWRKKII